MRGSRWTSASLARSGNSPLTKLCFVIAASRTHYTCSCSFLGRRRYPNPPPMRNQQARPIAMLAIPARPSEQLSCRCIPCPSNWKPRRICPYQLEPIGQLIFHPDPWLIRWHCLCLLPAFACSHHISMRPFLLDHMPLHHSTLARSSDSCIY